MKDSTYKPRKTLRTVEVFSQLGKMFGNSWIKEHGSSPTDDFVFLAESLCEVKMKRVYQHCQDRLASGNEWAPNLGALNIYSMTPPKTELREILHRVQSRKPDNDIERWIARKVDYELRRCPIGKELNLLREWYIHAEQLARRGELFMEEQELIALPSHSTKNLNDIEREKYESSGHKHKFADRIKSIIKSK